MARQTGPMPLGEARQANDWKLGGRSPSSRPIPAFGWSHLPEQTQHSADGLQETNLDQAVEMVPDIIGMGDAAEMKAQLEVGELCCIGQVGAGYKQLLIGHHRLDVTDSLLSFKG